MECNVVDDAVVQSEDSPLSVGQDIQAAVRRENSPLCGGQETQADIQSESSLLCVGQDTQAAVQCENSPLCVGQDIPAVVSLHSAEGISSDAAVARSGSVSDGCGCTGQCNKVSGTLVHSGGSVSEGCGCTGQCEVCSCTGQCSSVNGHAESSTDGPVCTAAVSPNLSKRQRKKLEKREVWLKNRPLKRQMEKERRKMRRALEAQRGALQPPSRTYKMVSSSCKLRVAVDLSYNHLMDDGAMNKCLKQLHRCYSTNRRAADPLQFYVTSFRDDTRRLMDKFSGWQRWDVNFVSESCVDKFGASSVVYLTSESEQVLENLDHSKVYVIGGLVDHNTHKGVSLQRAAEAGVGHARLPIDEYLIMKTRKVLTVDHVFHILLRVANGASWKESFLEVIPARKQAVVREEKDKDQ